MSAPSLAGKLLVATPSLEDPNFHRTVVFMIAHETSAGALGVVLNRPSELSVAEALPEWAPLVSAPDVVFAGGPVVPEGVICVGRADGAVADEEGWEPVDEEFGVVDLSSGPERLVTALAGVRVFAGHSGWGAHQLEAELAAGGWFVVEARPDDVLSPAPEDLWRVVLERQPPKIAIYAKAPPHLSLN